MAATSPASNTAKIEYDDHFVSLPLVTGSEGEVGIDIGAFRNETGAITLDPGFGNTGACRSAITFIDGDVGILRYRGYPIEDLAEESKLFSRSLVPADLRRATDRGAAPRLQRVDLRRHTMLHEDFKRFYGGDAEGRPPDGGVVRRRSARSRRSTRMRSTRATRVRSRISVQPTDREAADDGGVRLQALDRSALHVPRQQAPLRRGTFPAPDVRDAVRAVPSSWTR